MLKKIFLSITLGLFTLVTHGKDIYKPEGFKVPNKKTPFHKEQSRDVASNENDENSKDSETSEEDFREREIAAESPNPGQQKSYKSIEGNEKIVPWKLSEPED